MYFLGINLVQIAT